MILWFLAIIVLIVLAFFAWFFFGILLRLGLVWAPSFATLTIGGIFAYWLGGLGGAIVFLVTLGVAYKVYETWTFSDRFDRFSRRLDSVFGEH